MRLSNVNKTFLVPKFKQVSFEVDDGSLIHKNYSGSTTNDDVEEELLKGGNFQIFVVFYHVIEFPKGCMVKENFLVEGQVVPLNGNEVA